MGRSPGEIGSMYSEIEIIKQVSSKTARIKLYLAFIEEYSGWLQHLNEVGAKWGKDGEEDRAAKEYKKAKKHVERLKQELMTEFITRRHNKKMHKMQARSPQLTLC